MIDFPAALAALIEVRSGGDFHQNRAESQDAEANPNDKPLTRRRFVCKLCGSNKVNESP